MAHSRLLGILQRAAVRQHDGVTRGEFVRGAIAASVATASLPFAASCSSVSAAAQRDRVVIIGAGMAGLSAALRLHDAGIASTVYESSMRVGGRMHSERSYWNDGQHTEWCGAMVDTTHATIRGLARRFGLGMLDTFAAMPKDARDTVFLDGNYYPMTEVDRDFAAVWPVFRSQLAAVKDVTTYANATPAARRLDAMNVAQWIEKYVPGGLQSRLGKLMKEAYRNEYGRELEEQSSLNLVYMLGVQKHFGGPHGTVNVLGYSDQRYVLARGSQSVPEAVAHALPAGSIRFGHRLTTIRKLKSGSYEVRFDNGTAVLAERVVIAIPFIALRSVDYSRAGFSSAKDNAIQRLGYGYHTKLHLQFDMRRWFGKGRWPQPATGQIWTSTGFQNSIDFSLGQHGRSGLIERFTGANAAFLDTPPQPYSRMHESAAVQRHVKRFFAQLDEIWPGVSRTFNGKATFGNAQADPHIQASYSCWLVGQYTSIAGHEAKRQGNVHFAGEHCSLANQGFMEGAAETGVAAASEILSDYKMTGTARAASDVIGY